MRANQELEFHKKEEKMEEEDILASVRSSVQTSEGKRRASLVDVLTTSIREKGSKSIIPKPTEYYVALLSTLATCLTGNANGDGEVVNDLLFLLSKVVPQSPPAVLRLDPQASLASILSAAGKVSNPAGHRYALKLLGSLLRAQAKDAWSKPIVVKSFTVCLQKLLEENPKVRRASQEAVVEVLASHQSVPMNATMEYVLEGISSNTNMVD